jgi:two-component system OmpR family response regulator
MQILVVEDEYKIAQLLKNGLVEEHYTVDAAKDGDEALYKLSVNTYDLVLLDLMIPGVDGVSVCKEFRKANQSTPILILTAKDTIEDKVKGLDAGADDYVLKPFSFAELSARIRALLRRGNKADPVILKIDNLSLDPAAKIAKRNGTILSLTAREYELLEYFMYHSNVVLTKTQLLEHVWDYNYEGLSNIVETYIKYLRQKLRVDASSKELIHTVRGLGYKISS